MDIDAAKDAIMSAAIAILEINEAVGNPVPRGYEETGSSSISKSVSSVSNNGLNNRSVISNSTAVSNTGSNVVSEATNASSINTKGPSGNSLTEPDNINRQNTNLQRIQVNQPETGTNYLKKVYNNTPSLLTANQLGGRRATKKRVPRRRRRTQRSMID
jgi:hypothetical protein